jgi:hypothetical protein
LYADTEDVLRRRIKVEDQKALINKDDARAKAVENTFGVWVARSVVA